MTRLLRFAVQLGGFVTTVAGGLLIAASLASREDDFWSETPADAGLRVEVERLTVQTVDEPIVVFGTARAPRVYAIRSQVGGAVLETRLTEGAAVAAGSLLVRLDAAEIGSSIAETEARVRRVEARIDQLETRVAPIDAEIERMTSRSGGLEKEIALLEEIVRLAGEEVERVRRTVERGASSASSLNEVLQDLVGHEQLLVNRRNQLAEIPPGIRVQKAQREAILAEGVELEAERDMLAAQLARQRLDLDRSSITCPVDGVIVLAEPATGMRVKPLATGEIVTKGRDLAWILPSHEGMEIPFELDPREARSIRDPASCVLRVEWHDDPSRTWSGRIDRVLAGMDVVTRRSTTICKVDETDSGDPGDSLALVPGMYCRIEIPTLPLEDCLVMPRSGLREGRKVYVAARGLLDIRDIRIERLTRDRVVVSSGLAAGDLLITSPIPHPIQGMKIRIAR